MAFARSNGLSKFKAILIGGASLAALSPAMAFAQDDVDEIDEIEEAIDEAQSEDRIVVTGSRIRRNEFTSISPVQIVDGEVSRELGLFDAQEILNQTSVVQGPQTTAGLSTVLGSQGQAFTTFGSVTPSLRGLQSSVTGRARNLVLINSRRLGPIGVGGAPANPDVSLIPGSMIQRVDVLLDGASSVYGSDAIAGVINYVLRDDFEGFEVSGFYNSPMHIGGADQFIVSATFGMTGERGYVMTAAEFSESNDLQRVDRFPRYLSPTADNGFGQQICDPELEIDTQTGELFKGCGSSGLGGFSFFGPLGAVFPTPPGQADNTNIPGWSNFGTAPYENEVGFGSNTNPATFFFPEDQFVNALPGIRRFSMYSMGEYELGGYTNPVAYFEIQYGERELNDLQVGQAVIETTEDTPFNPGFGDSLLVPILHLDTQQHLDVFRALGGFKGDLPFLEGSFLDLSNWTYDISGSFHRSRGFQSVYGDLNQNNLARILNGSFDMNNQFQCALDETISGQQPSRAGPGGGFVTPVTQCDAYNLFDPQFFLTGRFQNPDANNFLLASTAQDTTVSQYLMQGFISGDLFTLPWAGDTVKAVFGMEYRQDSVLTITDELLATPDALSLINPDVGSNGSRRIIEGFAEISVPIISDVQFIEQLQVDVATRYTEEQFSGAAWTWQAKGIWKPFDSLTFTGGYGTSFRAPDTGEQFGTGIVFAGLTRADPCLPSTNVLEVADAMNTAPGQPGEGVPIGVNFYDATQEGIPAAVRAACQALGIVYPANNLDAAAAQALGLFEIGNVGGASFQNFSVLRGNSGNLTVTPETSRAFFAKVAFQQPWFESFDLNASVNYFDYLVEGSIGQLTQATILAACFDPATVAVSNGMFVGDLCEFQTRDPVSGLLTAVNEASFNLGSLTSKGLDFNLTFNADLPFLNSLPVLDNLDQPLNLGLVFRATRSFENSEDITGNGIFTANLGEPGFAKYQQNITTTLNYDRWSLLHRVFYATATNSGILVDVPNGGGTTLCRPALIGRGVAPAEADMRCQEHSLFPDAILHDVSVSYRGDTWSAVIGVRNLLDNVVVRDTGIPGDGDTGTPYNITGYDLDGRNIFLNVTKRF